MGCARYFREWHRPVRIVAVDAVGSVTFGGAAGPPDDPRPRHERPSAAARRVATSTRWSASRRRTPSAPATGWPAAGSCSAAPPARWSAAPWSWLAQHDGEDLTAVAIAPDLGERYLDTVYQTNWLQDLYGEDVLDSNELIAGSGSA